MAKRSGVVSASEIASWEWCPESWRLQAIGEEPLSKEELARGKRLHERNSFVERASGTARILGWWLLAAGIVAAGAALLLLKNG